MKAIGNESKVIHGNSGHGTDRLPSSRAQIIAAAVGLVVLLGGGASTLPRSDSDRANDAAAQPRAEVHWQTEPTTLDYFPDSPERDADRTNATAAQAGSAAFVYFPSQYENQAKEREEHIQAF
jgi:hypothetical protein